MKAPKNQYQLVLWYLITWREPFSLVDVIKDSMFIKFGTRLCEIENQFGTITKKERRKFTNTFGNKSSYLVYSLTDIKKALEIYEKI
jgi:hypothetical protein